MANLWWSAALVVVAGGAAYYLLNRELADYYIRLYFARRIAHKFYAEYPRLARNVAYGPNPTQKLDVYQPQSGSGHPVLVWVHGGSWNSGNKELYAPIAQRLLPEGIAVVVIGYTLFPQATYRQQTADVASAIAWVLENIDQYGGDRRRVVVGGQSAGAHLTALALLDEQWLAARGHGMSEVRGFYGISGVYDLDAQMAYQRIKREPAPIMTAVMEGETNFGKASPANYVRPGFPPALLIHGDADMTVPLSVTQVFHDRLLAAGGQSRFLTYERAGHSALLFDALAQQPARLVSDLSELVRGCI